MHIVLINQDIEPTHCSGASILAAAVYPLASEKKRWGEVHAKLCATALRQVNPEDALFDTRLVHPIHAALADGNFKFGSHFADRLSTRSMVAAVVTPILWQDITGPLPRLPIGMKRVSLNEGIRRAVELGLTGGAERNFERQAFKPTLPVLHLICGMHLVAWSMMQRGAQLDLRAVLFDANIVRAIVVASNLFLPRVLDRWGAQVNDEDIWAFQLID